MKKYQITGSVIGEKSLKPIPGLKIEAWDKENVIDDMLGSVVSNEKGSFSISFTETNEKDNIEEGHLIIYFKIYIGKELLFDTYNKIFWNIEIDNEDIIIPVPYESEAKVVDDPRTPKRKVSGIVTTEKGVAVTNVSVLVVNFLITGSQLLGETQTDSKGNYSIQFNTSVLRNDDSPDIQAKVFDTGKDSKEIGSSDIFYNTDSDVQINVTVKSEEVPRPSEHDRLINSVKPVLMDKPLTKLQVNEHTDDITHLANKTGWDARAIAMVAQAEILSEKTKVSPTAYYALFRCGAASTEDEVNKLTAKTIESELNNAVANNIIPDTVNIESDLLLIKKNAVKFLLSDSYKSGISNMNSMLDLSLNDSQKRNFALILHETGGAGEELWTALKGKGFPQKTIAKLQLDGKLGFLTIQNSDLVKKLYDKHSITEPSQLVDAGLYKPSEWKKLNIKNLPENVNIDDYVQAMANKVKESYPTYVLADMIKKKDVVSGKKEHLEEVTTFLRKSKLEDCIGAKPIKNWEGFKKLHPESQMLAKKVERLYQLSPSDEAMKTLSKINLSSAFEITKLTREEFKTKCGDEFNNSEEVDMVYTKAHEIYSTVINIATSYITARTSPNVYAITGKTDRSQNAN